MNARVAFGLPTYNGADNLAEALESLLGQTYRDFAIVVVDDRSTDDTLRVLERYRRLDPRIQVLRNERRLGMIANWRRAFEETRIHCPGLKYFAWASDHDIWHPRWLEAMVESLESHPRAVAAYPFNLRLSDAGEVLIGPWAFDTVAVTDRGERFRRTWWGMSAGNMVYGLFQADELARAGVFRPVLMPDRLLLATLSLHGEFVQVRELLWYRRFAHEVTMARQRRSFFPDRPPLYSYLPWWTMHGVVLAWTLGVKGASVPCISRLEGLGIAGRVLTFGAWMEARKRLRRKRLRRFGVLRLARRSVRRVARLIWMHRPPVRLLLSKWGLGSRT